MKSLSQRIGPFAPINWRHPWFDSLGLRYKCFGRRNTADSPNPLRTDRCYRIWPHDHHISLSYWAFWVAFTIATIARPNEFCRLMSCAPSHISVIPPMQSHLQKTNQRQNRYHSSHNETLCYINTTGERSENPPHLKKFLKPEYYWIDLFFGLQLEWAAGRSDKAIVL